MIHILYVDDEAGLLDLGKVYLERSRQFIVDTVTTAAEALKLMQSRQYDAIVSDYQMPGMDGIQFLRKIRKAGSTIPFIIFTGRGREEIVIQALNEGADFYLQKGGDPTAQFAELAHKIRLAVRERNAVSALEKSEERYRAVVEDQTELICRFTPGGKLTFANDAYCRYFGLDRDKCIMKHHPIRMPPEDSCRMQQHFASLSPENPVGFIEHRILMPDGTLRWQRWNDRAIFDKNGHVMEYQSVGRDNTELKQAEEALQESEEKYRTAIEKTREAVIIAQDGLFVFANESMGLLLGVPQETLVGKPFIDFIWPDDRELVQTSYGKRIAGQEVADTYDFRVIGADGRMRWVTISAARIHWHGRLATINLLADITERKQAEAELKESEEKFSAAFTINPDPVAITETETGKIIEANPAFSQWSGYSPGELVGKTTTELNLWIDEKERNAVLSTLKAHKEVIDREVRFLVKSREEGVCLFSARFISIGGKEFLFTRARDITSRKQAEEALKKSERRMRSLLASMNDLVFVLDRDLVFKEYYQPPDVELLVRSDFFIGKSFDEIAFPEPANRIIRDALVHTLQTGDLSTAEYYLDMPDGRSWYDLRVTSLAGDSDAPAGLTCVARNITGRKCAEEELRRSEMLYRSILNASPEDITITDLEGRVKMVSPAGMRMFGYTQPENIIGRSIFKLLVPEDHDRAVDKLKQIYQGSLSKGGEYRVFHADGHIIDVEVNADFIRDKSGNPTGIVFIGRDITARKKTEEALRESGERFRAIFTSQQNGIMIIDPADHQIIDVNPYFCTLAGLPKDHIIGNVCHTFVCPAERGRCPITDLCQDIDNAERVMLAADGTRIPVLKTVVRIMLDGKEYLIENIQDISERKRIEEALKESKERYQTIVEQATDVFYRQDMRTGRFEYISPKVETLLGFTPDEVLALGVDEQEAAIHPDDLPGLVPFPDDLVAADNKGDTIVEREFRMRHKDGEYRWVHGSYTLVRDDEGVPSKVIGSLHDITGNKKAEKDLLQSEERYRTIVERSFDGLIVHQDGKVVFANKTALDLIADGDPDGVIGKSALTFVHPDYHDIAARRMEAGTGETQPVMREKLVRTDGRTIDADVVAIPFTWNGKPAVYVIFRDMTRQIEVEEAFRKQAKTLSIFNEVITAANRAKDLPSLLDAILKKTIALLDYDAGGIYITDPATKTATVVVSYNLPSELLAKIGNVSIAEAPYDTLLLQGNPIITDHYDHVSPEHARESGFRSLASIPLVSGDRVIGAMNVVSKRREIISDHEQETLISIGRELGTTIDRFTIEEEAKKSAGNLELLFNSIDEMVFILAMDGTILRVNDTVLKKLQYAEEEIIGNNVLFIHVPERREEALQIVQGMVAGMVDSCPVPVLAKDGTRIEVETKVTRGWWDNHDVLIGITRDITKRKQVEEALRESEEKFRALVETTGDFIWEVNVDGVYTYVSPQVHQILGYEPGEILGKTPFDLMPPDEAEWISAEFERSIAARLPIVTLENKARKKDGTVVILETSGVPWIAPDGSFFGYRGIDRDITRRKEAEETLRKKTHDLRERVKELRCLYEIARIIETEEPVEMCLQKFCDIIPTGWQFPERISARIRISDRTFCSPNFLESREKMTCALMVGKDHIGEIEVFSLGSTDESAQGPFLPEESDLINAIAERIGRMLERVQVEEALNKKTEELDQYFTTSLDLFCIADTKGYFLRLNPEWEKTLGYTLAELEGNRFLDFVHPDDLDATLAAMADLSSQKEVLNFTNRYQHKDGTYRWIEWRSHPRGNLIFAAARDITRHYFDDQYTAAISRLKQDLLISAPLSEKLKKITDTCVSTFGADFARIWITGPGDLCGSDCVHAAVTEGLNVCKNRSACLHLIVSSGRYTHTDGTHRRVPFGAFKIGRIGSGEDSRFIINDVLNDPRVHDHAWAATLGLVSFAGFQLTSSDGKSIGVLAFFSRQPISPDMTNYFDDLAMTASQVIQTSTVEEALRDSEEKYRSIIENSQDMIYRTDLEGRFTMISPAGARLVGYNSPDELIGHFVSESYLNPDDRVDFLEALKKKGSVTGYPVTLKSADGSIRYTLASSHFYHDAHGNVLGVEGLLHDITDLHWAEEGLRMANKKLQLLSSITRHDILNQLTAMRGYLDLSEDSKVDPTLRTYLERMKIISQAIQKQIDFTREYQDIGVVEPAWQSVKTCIDETTTSLPVRDVRIIDGTGSLEIFADPLLTKVFYNLIDNSLRYGGERLTTITISSREAGNGLVLTCKDDGTGISEVDRPRLFERGFGKNTGLGLFLVRDILGITGITITETGEAGKGAQFEIRVPDGLWRLIGRSESTTEPSMV